MAGRLGPDLELLNRVNHVHRPTPHPALRAVAILALLTAVATPAAGQSGTAGAVVDSTIAIYCAAWGTADRTARDRMLERVWAPQGRYSDPTPTEAVGRAALSAVIDGFLRSMPGARFRCSAPQLHHGYLRFTWSVAGADGVQKLHGMDFGELDADGRIRRIVGFFGPAPEPR